MVDQKQPPEGVIEANSSTAITRKHLTERIQRFEQIYETASKNMARAVSVGVIRETAEIAEWMKLYRERLDY